MDDARWFSVAAALVALLVTAGGVAAIALTPASPSPKGPGTPAPMAPTTYRTLVISADPATGAVNYAARNLAVPLHERVVITILNYDPSIAKLPTPADAQVRGTYGGPMAIVTPAGSSSAGQIPANGVSHTFSMSNEYYAINVPIPPSPAAGTPSEVQFAVVFNTPGTFDWGCVVLCLGDGMDGAGPMFGSLTVG